MSVDDLKVRVPRDLKDWLKHKAKVNSRTMNGEVLHLLKIAKQAEEEGA